ncbi:hypothetical protein Scep_027893 [Stephania cephalantha]|uniref:RNase H type-1 domain-containing protein n=1 Tax=Stephania cephalantha TaxID=152367 RepID=A0AAP0E8X4_9MAGN
MGRIGQSTNLIAELWAIREGLQLALELGYRKVIMVSNSSIALQLITSPDENLHLLVIVYAAIKKLEDRLLAIIDVKEGKSGKSSTAGQNTNESQSQEHMNSQNIKDPEGGNRKGRPPTER